MLRVLFDPEFASGVQALQRAPQLPEPEPPETLPSETVTTAHEPPPQQVDGAINARTGALQLLSLLQREGRLIDFVQQDITSFADADVGAAARVVHQGCRRALAGLGTIAAIRSETEGSPVTLDGQFDRGAVKLVGNVTGSGPYRGVLRHKGWRAESLKLPEFVGNQDPRVLAPAEVEL